MKHFTHLSRLRPVLTFIKNYNKFSVIKCLHLTDVFIFETSAPVACFLEVFSGHICYWRSFIGWNEVLQERKNRE